MHILQFCLTSAQLFHNRTNAFFRHINNHFFDWLVTLAIDFVIQNPRSRNAQFIAFSPHIFNQNGEVHFASAGNPKGIRAIGFGYTQRNVPQQFPHQTVTQLTRGYKFPLLTSKRAVVDTECHFYGRFTDFCERERFKAIRSTNGIADGNIGNAADPNNIADGCRFCWNFLQPLNLQQRNNFVPACRFWVVIVPNHNLLVDLNRTTSNSADTDSANIFIIVNRRNQHLQRSFRVTFRRIYIVHDGVKQRNQIRAVAVRVERCRTISTRAVQEWGIFKLFFACIQIHQQFQHFISDFVQTCIRSVNLIDNYDDFQVHFQSFLQNETSLRHRTFCGIDQQQCTVYHTQHPFYLAAEVCVSRCVNDIDFNVTVPNRGIFRQNGDTSFPFQCIRVHDTLCNCLIFTEHTALFQHFVYQCGLAVVNVCNNRNISQIFSQHGKISSFLLPLLPSDGLSFFSHSH